jgi:hypothetical protein
LNANAVFRIWGNRSLTEIGVLGNREPKKVVVARVLRGEDNKLLIGTTLGTTTEREMDWGGGGLHCVS